MNYCLTIGFKPEDLRIIRSAKQQIALAKPMANATHEVVWLTFEPFESNVVEWTNEYGLYVSSPNDFGPEQRITKLAEVDPDIARDGGYYPFNAEGAFDNFVESANVPAGTYGAKNHMPWDKYPDLNFGLTQSAQVNQQSLKALPLTANTVLSTQKVQLTPSDKVYLWLQSQIEPSILLTKAIGDRTVLSFDDGVSEIGVTYDAQTGRFTQD